jgi:hypothetical protein
MMNMAKLKELDGETLQNIVKNLSHHWRNDEVLNFLSAMDYLKKKYAAEAMNQIIVHLKWQIEGGFQ